MCILSILLLTLGILCVPAQAAHTRHSVSRQLSPAQGILQNLRGMSTLLDSVDTRASADAAAPRLLELNKEFHKMQEAAEDHPPANLNRHLAEMDLAMNDFRLACARVLQEKCYGSTKLGQAIKTVANRF